MLWCLKRTIEWIGRIKNLNTLEISIQRAQKSTRKRTNDVTKYLKKLEHDEN